METFRLYMLTWNVATRPPEEDVKSMLGLREQMGSLNQPDMFVVGLQEVKSQPQNMLMDALMGNPWTNAFRDPLARCGYIIIRTVRLQGIVLLVFILRKHLLRVRDIESLYTKTGFGGMWGNKGAVSVRFAVSGVSVCLLNCHLTPHDHLLADRISDYNIILDDQVFSIKETANIFFHDYVFWIGDLNFRLKEEAGTAVEIDEKLRRKGKTSGNVTPDVKKSSEKTLEDCESDDFDSGNIKSLLEEDQLHFVMTSGAAFSELVEEPITFPPTYKFLFNSSDYDLKRRPSWTDRILYRVNENAYENLTLGAKQLSYKSHPQYLQSDHKPVTAQFEIKVISDYEDRLVHFHPIGTWYLDEENFASFALGDDVNATPWDWIGVFKEGFVSIEDYVSYVYVPKPPESFSTLRAEVAEEATASDSADDSKKNVLTEDADISSCKSGAKPKKQRAWMRATFPDTSLQSTGTYQLLYLTQGSSSVLGISAPFRVERRDPMNKEVGLKIPMHQWGAASAPSTPSRATLD
ncbi:hypothetical protein J437_LFUL010298 [Ladona fulva]|uniref:Inositol polyphosphate-related phosphatase domain-containing protein n=1 Tax=Ladona fulva TaxID=123851 RepID=A0A8K0P0W5_LADFU|nr:hypothetical protein J437_LFUL010298 [Ladona fulva]